jgi:hypothetical protein
MRKLILLGLFAAGCATQTPADQAAEVSLGPDGMTVTTVEPAPETSNPEDEKWERVEDFLAQKQTGEIDAKEMLGLWDEQGRFRTDYWQSLTHERRMHCVAVLALCGNAGAIRAQGGELSEDTLRKEGPYIANGTFGAPARSWLDRWDEPRSGRITFDVQIVPDWYEPSNIPPLKRGLPLVIYFPGEIESELAWADPAMATLRRYSAVFIKVPYTADREQSVESVIPYSKIHGDNPSRDYKIPLGGEVVIVADSHGNEFFRLTDVPQADGLEEMLDKVPQRAAELNKKLQANLDKANAHLEKGERRDALKYLMKNIREDVVGFEAQEATFELYIKLIEDGYAELEKLVQAGDKEGLQALAREFAGTYLEKPIEEALAKLK